VAFLQFLKDKEVKVISTEKIILDEEYCIAGTIDLLCYMNFNGKRVKALIDIKSSKENGTNRTFSASHEAQLHAYMQALNKSICKDERVEMCFNFSPNNWQSEPTYTLKNQTKSVQSRLIDKYVSIYNATHTNIKERAYIHVDPLTLTHNKQTIKQHLQSLIEGKE
jgi:hypothetical protein